MIQMFDGEGLLHPLDAEAQRKLEEVRKAQREKQAQIKVLADRTLKLSQEDFMVTCVRFDRQQVGKHTRFDFLTNLKKQDFNFLTYHNPPAIIFRSNYQDAPDSLAMPICHAYLKPEVWDWELDLDFEYWTKGYITLKSFESMDDRSLSLRQSLRKFTELCQPTP